MHRKWKLSPLVLFLVLAGCGGSGSGESHFEPPTASAESGIDTRSVDAPVCTNTVTELMGCWASSCEVLNTSDGDLAYGRSVISFAKSGDVRHYMQGFENSNCVAPATYTIELLSGLTYDLSPRVVGEDEANVQGHIEITLDDSLAKQIEDWDGEPIVTSTPYDITVVGALCLDSNRVVFRESGYEIRDGSPTLGIDYENCLSRLR